ncbi:MAG: hypothetical protein ACLUIQ_03465 [Dialister invisus]
MGGKNKLDKQNTYLKQTYDIAQVGYDKKKETGQSGRPWTTEQERHLRERDRKRKTGKPCPVRNHAERRWTVHRRHPERKQSKE